jgi:hypothetical protein
VTDGRVLDPTWPEGLLYAHTAREPVLVAAVYLMNRAGEPGRAVGGCLTHWHVHDKPVLERPGQGDDHRRAHAERPLPAWTDRVGGAADAAHLGD